MANAAPFRLFNRDEVLRGSPGIKGLLLVYSFLRTDHLMAEYVEAECLPRSFMKLNECTMYYLSLETDGIDQDIIELLNCIGLELEVRCPLTSS
jgi:hypothetical protein